MEFCCFGRKWLNLPLDSANSEKFQHMSDYLSDRSRFNTHRPHDNRRARFHDYKRPGDYMITLKKASGCPDFSVLEGDPFSRTDPPRVRLYPAGMLIEREMRAFLDANPWFEFLQYVIMPDHVHIYWRVKTMIEKDLGVYIGYFKAQCTGKWKKYLSDRSRVRNGKAELDHGSVSGDGSASGSALASGSVSEAWGRNHRSDEVLFQEKFNDRIAFPGIEEQLKNYILDNPRRRLIVLKYPHLFQRVRNVRIDDQVMDCYGNFQLLRFPFMSAAVVSTRYSAKERAAKEMEWDWVIRNRGVLVSPFISTDERTLMKRCLEGGGSIIRILADGIPARYRPAPAELPTSLKGGCFTSALRASQHTALTSSARSVSP